MTDWNADVQDQRRTAPSAASWRDRVLARGLEATFGETTRGRLDVILPSGLHVMLGRDATPPARVTLHTYRAIWRLATRGSIGLAESYMRSEIDTPDLACVLRFCIKNYNSLEQAGGGVFKPRFSDILWHRRRNNTRQGSRRNIAAHYDLGNAFYALWLDPGMTYSSAIFRSREQTLSAAQDEKYRVVLDQLDLKRGDTLLEIGCGWGGLAERAIGRGAHVTGLTLSAEQLSFARQRLAAKGCAANADLRFQDYRDTDGTFDAIASVEMIEAVGEAHWPDYFAALAKCLKPGGSAAVQAITIDERFFEAYRRHTDFIQRYIFPGGMLPTVTRMREEAVRAGLTFETVEQFGQSYAHTLDAWRERFRARWPEIQALGFDERFRRMWEYYLSYCEVGFESGDVNVGIYRMTKPLKG
ncbi:MAG: class I SAM-dependent methyltransferase [Hyphomicrobium sp.]|nr:class I SAM-dependent methyltransferase [Hyphomicrobium sp.]